MPTLLICPDCGKKYSVADDSKASGRLCRYCQAKLVVSAADDGMVEIKPAVGGYPSGADGKNISLETPELPKQIGRYEVRAELGSGGFGRVFRAFDPTLDREVAIKVPHPWTLQSAKAVERFIREAKAGARLRHPNIVPVYDTEQNGAQCYIVSAYIQGETLADALERGPWEFRRIAQVVRQLAEALHYAHQQKIVHRDVKPANVLIDELGQPHLMDFGLAHLQDAGSVTQGDIGTPYYMAPEQAGGKVGKNVAACDQYSLGILTYEMLTGQVPFSGPLGRVISAHLHEEPPPPRSINPEIPEALEAICLKTLAKKPEERHFSCASLADSLQRWLTPIATAAPPTVLPQPVKPVGPTAEPKPIIGSLAFLSGRLVARFRKLDVRVRMSIVAGALVLVLIVGFIGTGRNLETKQNDPLPTPAGSKQVRPTYSELDLGNGVKMKFVRIAPGTFWMGSPQSEQDYIRQAFGKEAGDLATQEKQHEVQITKPFCMGIYEVTQGQYRQVMGDNPSNFKTADDYPVESVTWDDAAAFCRKASDLAHHRAKGWMIDLPTEAQWEYCCRAGTETPFSFGETISTDQANFNGTEVYGNGKVGANPQKTLPVGSFPANAWGLYGMHGNVEEWCKDLYSKTYYQYGPRQDPPGANDGSNRVLRGGAWYSFPRGCRCAFRNHYTPVIRGDGIGFRVVLSSPEDSK